MKRINILVISALSALALVACGSTQPAGSSSSGDPASSVTSREEGDYLFYKLKEGQTKDGLEGSPWVNSVKDGIGKKLIKPSEKDDFYLNRTYEMQNSATLEPGDMAIGGMPGAIKEISKRTSKMLSEKTTSAYGDTLNQIFNLYSKVDKTNDERYVKSIIDEIKAISSLDALAEYLYNKGYDSVWPLFEIVRDKKDGLSLKEDNMGLTPSSINYSYLNGTEEEKQRVSDTAVYLLGLYGYNETEAKEVLDKATNAYRDATSKGIAVENTSVKEIDSLFPHLRLKDYFSIKLGYTSSTNINVDTPRRLRLGHLTGIDWG